MKFADYTTLQGIVQKIDELCDSTDTSYTRLHKTRNVNEAYKQVVGWIINADGTWQFDDSNMSDEPKGTFNLVEGQQSYTFAADYLQIEMMEILDVDGNWKKIKPLDHSDLYEQSPDEYFGVDASGNPNKGFPLYFDLFTDDSFRLYPAPTADSATLTAGGRVWFKRIPTAFSVVGTPASPSTADDNTEPGFASPFHEILAYMASIPYCMKYHKDRVNDYRAVIGDFPRPVGMKEAIIKHYAYREKSKRKIMTPHLTPFR